MQRSVTSRSFGSYGSDERFRPRRPSWIKSSNTAPLRKKLGIVVLCRGVTNCEKGFCILHLHSCCRYTLSQRLGGAGWFSIPLYYWMRAGQAKETQRIYNLKIFQSVIFLTFPYMKQRRTPLGASICAGPLRNSFARASNEGYSRRTQRRAIICRYSTWPLLMKFCAAACLLLQGTFSICGPMSLHFSTNAAAV